MLYTFAPMEGITTSIFRTVYHRRFPAADRYYMPFLSPTSEHRLTPRERREVAPEWNRELPVVPQIITRHAEDFLWAAETLADMGYPEVNLNLGCPSATVTAKGKGSGLLLHPDELCAMLDTVYEKSPVPVSIKTRIGYHDASEWERLLSIYLRFPVRELIVHPRTRQELYTGEVHMDAYLLAERECPFPVCYNGDLATPMLCRDFAQAHPTAHALMIGRGAVRDPAFFRILSGGAPADKGELLAFHTELYDAYTAELGRHNAMRKMKEVWHLLIGSFENSEKEQKKLARTQNAADFEAIVADVFQRLELKKTEN